MLGARCKIQNGYYNIHDASQGTSCKLHHNILHFLQCYFYILHFKAPLKHILQKMNLNRWKISPHKLFSKQIVNRALRSTLNASLLDEKKIPFPESCLRNNFTFLFWNIFLNLCTVYISLQFKEYRLEE